MINRGIFSLHYTELLEAGDKIIVQGEFGATFSLVGWLQRKGYSVYYATSRRKVAETVKGDQVLMQRLFEHVNFREYPVWEETE